jgi:hypothetical protein
LLLFRLATRQLSALLFQLPTDAWASSWNIPTECSNDQPPRMTRLEPDGAVFTPLFPGDCPHNCTILFF